MLWLLQGGRLRWRLHRGDVHRQLPAHAITRTRAHAIEGCLLRRLVLRGCLLRGSLLRGSLLRLGLLLGLRGLLLRFRGLLVGLSNLLRLVLGVGVRVG